MEAPKLTSTDKDGKVTEVQDVDHNELVKTDEKCNEILDNLKTTLPNLSKAHVKLLDKCLEAVAVEDGEASSFGPLQLCDLAMMALDYPDREDDIMGVYHHLMNSLEMMGDAPEDVDIVQAKIDTRFDNMVNGDLDDKEESDEDEDVSDSDDTSETESTKVDDEVNLADLNLKD
jgi:hypothetical protein